MPLSRHLPALSIALAAALSVAAPAAEAGLISYEAYMDGPSENPSNASPGTGYASVVYDDVGHTLTINAQWSGLVGPTTVAHIHCCVAPPGNVGVAVTPGTLPGFPAGVTAGNYATVIDLTLASSYTAGFVTNFAGGLLANAESALISGFDAGRAYFNIHTSTFTGGEIRGFLARVPEPASMALLALGLAGLGVARRK